MISRRNGRIVLISMDFNMSRKMNKEGKVISDRCEGGTKGYLAPEISAQHFTSYFNPIEESYFPGPGENFVATTASDVYSLGENVS